MEQVAGAQMQSCNNSSTSPRTLYRSTHIMLDRTKEIPKVGNISILPSTRSLDHFTKLFIFGIEILFQVGDGILRV